MTGGLYSTRQVHYARHVIYLYKISCGKKMTKMQKCDWRGCTDSDAKDLALYSGKSVLDVDVLPRLAHRLCYFWLFWAQAVMIFHQICGIVLPLDPEMAQTSTSSDIVRHKLPHMWEKSAQSLTDDEQYLEIMIYICY